MARFYGNPLLLNLFQSNEDFTSPPAPTDPTVPDESTPTDPPARSRSIKNPFANDPFGRGALPRRRAPGGLPDDPNETRDDEQWDAWGAPKRLADDPRDDETWQSYDEEYVPEERLNPFANDPFGRGLPLDDDPRDDETWQPYDEEQVLPPPFAGDPFADDPFGRGRPLGGGLPDDPNETRDDEQWDAWGAPKRLADDPRDDATWQSYDYEQPVRDPFDIDSYWRDTFGFLDVEDIRRQGEQPWSDDQEPLANEEDLKSEYDALSTEAGNLADAALQSFWNVLGATDEGEDLSWTVDTASDRMALSFYSGAEGAIAYFVGSTKEQVTALERSLYEAARPEVEEQVRDVLIGLTSDSQAAISMRWVHRGNLPLMWLEIRFWGARRDVDASPSDANETRDDEQWDAWGAGKAVVSDPRDDATWQSYDQEYVPGLSPHEQQLAIRDAQRRRQRSSLFDIDSYWRDTFGFRDVEDIRRQGEVPWSDDPEPVYDHDDDPRDDATWDPWGAGKRLADDWTEQMDPGYETDPFIQFPEHYIHPLQEEVLGVENPLGRVGGTAQVPEAGGIRRGWRPEEDLEIAEGVTILPRAWQEALLEAWRLGADVFSISKAWADVPPGMVPHPVYPNYFFDENLVPYHYKDGELKRAPWNYDFPKDEMPETTFPDGRIKKGAPFEANDPRLSNVYDFTDAQGIRPLNDDELTWLPEIAREHVFVSLEGEYEGKYVDKAGKALFLLPWEWKWRVDEGETDPWLYQFLEEFLAPELKLLGFLGVEHTFLEESDISEEDIEYYVNKYERGDYNYLKNLPEHGEMIGEFFESFDSGRLSKALFAKWLKTLDEQLIPLGGGEESAEEGLKMLEQWAVENEESITKLRPDELIYYLNKWDGGEYIDKLNPSLSSELTGLVQAGLMEREELAVYLYLWETMQRRKQGPQDLTLPETQADITDAVVADFMARIRRGEFDHILRDFSDEKVEQWQKLPDKDRVIGLWKILKRREREGKPLFEEELEPERDEQQIIEDAKYLASMAEETMREHAAGRENTVYELGLDNIQTQPLGNHGYLVMTIAHPPSQLPSPPDWDKPPSGFGDDFHHPARDVDSLDVERRARKEMLSVWREMERYRTAVEIALQLVQELKEQVQSGRFLLVEGVYYDIVIDDEERDPENPTPVFTASQYQMYLAQQAQGDPNRTYEIPKRVLWGIRIYYMPEEGDVGDLSAPVPVEDPGPSGTITLPSPKVVADDWIEQMDPGTETDVFLPELYIHPLQEEVDFVPNPIGRVGGEAQVPEARGIRRGQHPEDRDYVAPGILLITDNVLIYQDPWSGERFYQDQDTGEWYHVDSKDGTITKRAPRRTDTPPITELPDDSTPLGRRLREILFESLPDDMYYNPDIGHFVRINEHGQHIVQFDYSPWEYQAREGVTYEEREERHRRNQLRARAEADPNVFFDEQRGRLYYLDTITGTYVGTDDHGRPIIVDKDGNPVDVAALGLETTAQLGEHDPSVTGPTATLGERLPYYYDEITEQWIGVDEHGRPETLDGPPEGYYWNAVTGIAFHQADDGLWYGRTVEGRVYMTDPSGFPIDPETGEFIDWQKPVNQPRDVVPHPYYYDEGLGQWVVVDPESPGGYRIAARPPEGYYYNAITKISFTQLADGTWMGLYEGRVVRVDDTGFPIDIEGNPVDWQQEGWIDQVWAGGVEPIAGEAFDRDWSNETPIDLEEQLRSFFEHYFTDEFGDAVPWHSGIFQDVPDSKKLGFLKLLESEGFDFSQVGGDQAEGQAYDILHRYMTRVVFNVATAGELAMREALDGRGSEVGHWLADTISKAPVEYDGREGYAVGTLMTGKTGIMDTYHPEKGVVTGEWDDKGGEWFESDDWNPFRKDKEYEGRDWIKLVHWFNGIGQQAMVAKANAESEYYGLNFSLTIGRSGKGSGYGTQIHLSRIEVSFDASNILSMIGLTNAPIGEDYPEVEEPPDFPQLPTGEEHSEFDPGFDIPEVGDALFLAEHAASIIRRDVGGELAGTVRIAPEYLTGEVIYLIGSTSSAANESNGYTFAVQRSIVETAKIAEERAVADFIQIGLASMPATDDPAVSTMAVKISFGVRYNQETETWEAVRERETIDIWGSSRVRNAAMKDVVDFAVQALKRECPVRTGTMRNSISARPTDHSFKGNISTYWDIGARVQYSRFVASYRSAVDRAVVATKAYAAQYAHQGIEGIVVHEALIELPSGADKYGAPFGPGMVIEFGQAQGGFWKDLNFGPGSFDLIHPDVINWLFGTDLQPGDLTPPGLPGGSWDLPDEIADEDEYDDDDDDAKSSLPFRLRF